MIELTDGLPAHHHDKIPRDMVGSSHEMVLDSHQIVGYCTGDSGLHDWRQKLVRRAMVVSRPQHCPIIMGKTQALTVAHGPPTLPVVAPAQPKTSTPPASQGLSTLGGGGVLSQSVPNAKSHLVARIQTPSLSPHRHLSEVSRSDRSHKSVLIYPTGHSGHHPITPQATIRTPVGAAAYNIKDV